MIDIDEMLSDDRLLIPVDAVLFAQLPSELCIDGLVLRLKDEFHVTVLNEEVMADLKHRIGDEPQQRRTLGAYCAQLRWRWQSAHEHWLLRYQPPEEALAHSIVRLIDMPDANGLRDWLAEHLGMGLGPIPAHITLYVAGRDKGIGLASMAEFKTRGVRQLRLAEFSGRQAP